MSAGIARQAGALAALVTVLARNGDGLLVPSALAVAGTVGLTVYGALALGPRLGRRLLTAPAASGPAAPAPPPSPDAPTS